MNRKSVVIIMFCGLLSASLAINGYGQSDLDRPSGKTVRVYREDPATPETERQRPDWVESAFRQSRSRLQNELKTGYSDDSFLLESAEQDDLGQTHLRFEQYRNDVFVFGGRFTTHVDGSDKVRLSGRIFTEGKLSTRPIITPEKALDIARSLIDPDAHFMREPEAKLVILPRFVVNPRASEQGGTLTYLVELFVEDSSAKLARHFYFVNARTGDIVLHYDNLQTQATGTGITLYSGTVNFTTTPQSGGFILQDNGRGGSRTFNMNFQTSGGSVFFDSDNIWGNGSTSSVQTVGADAHFGMSKTWDYFSNVHGRWGIDGSGFRLDMRVHYGSGVIQAFWLSPGAYFGDGNGSTAGPLTSVDTVAHEITHGLIEKTANLTYSNESGGSNESFADIFGTAVEFSTGINPDYNIGEDWTTPSIPNDGGLRDMSNPPVDGNSIDHYSNYFPGMDVHYSSGIQNKAFYLLAQSQGIAVAERIYYRALTVYLFPSATFTDVRNATDQAIIDLYGYRSPPAKPNANAWAAVGLPFP